MSDIVVSKGIRSNLLQLQNTAANVALTQSRLASGKKVNSALDNPSNFFTASALNSRAGDLANLLDSLSNGIKVIEAADNGLTAITKTIESLQSTVRQARQDKSNKTSSYTLDTAGIGSASAKSISFSGGAVGSTPVNIALNTPGTTAVQSTVVGSAAFTAPTAAVQNAIAAADTTYTPPTAAVANSIAAANGSYTAPVAASAAQISTIGFAMSLDDPGDHLTFDFSVDGGASQSVSLTQSLLNTVGDNDDVVDDAAELQALIQAALTVAGVTGVTVGNDGSNVTLTSDTVGASSAISMSSPLYFNGGGANNLAMNFFTPIGSHFGTGAAAVDRAITVGDGTNTASITLTSANAATAADAAATINAALTSAGIVGTVTGDNGNGKLTLTGAADGSNTLSIGGADADAVFGTAGTRTSTAAATAVDRVVTIADGTNTANVTLTSANAATASAAAATLSAALTSAGIAATATGDNANGKLALAGAADGSNTLTIGGADADAVFGTAGTRTVTSPATAVDRVVTIGDGTNTATVTLTSANAANAAAAVATINAALTSAGITGSVTESGGTLSLAGAADGSNSLTIGGADADAVFGAGRTAASGTVAATGSTKTLDEIADAINGSSALAGKIRASNDNGKLRIENQSTAELTVGGIGTSSGKVDGTAGTRTIGANDVRKNLVTQFNDLRNQLDKLSDDASFNGINLLRGDKLKLTFNETSTSTLEIQAKDTAGNVREISNSKLGIVAATNAEFEDDSRLDSRLDGLKGALDTIRSQASSFGSNLSIVQNRQDFTKNTINTLKGGADNLVLADANEEAANLLSLQTRQQLSQTALSLANQADQGVLRLF